MYVSSGAGSISCPSLEEFDPCLKACFASEDGGMAVSLGDEEAEGCVEFCGGQYEIAAYQVIPVVSALECALDFFHSQDCPDCIEWEEL